MPITDLKQVLLMMLHRCVEIEWLWCLSISDGSAPQQQWEAGVAQSVSASDFYGTVVHVEI